MGRPLRHQSSSAYYFITNRCADGMFLMRPDPECRRIIAGCLARYAEQMEVKLVCFGFFSNHFHLIAAFPRLNRDGFMGRVTGEISGRLNSLRDRSGPMFPVRYDSQQLCDEQAVRDKICYVLNNPVKDGLVPRAEAWPGVSSIPCHESGEGFSGRWLDHNEWSKLQARKTSEHNRAEAMVHHTIELELPDALEGDTKDERRACLLELVEKDRERLHAEAEATLGCPPKFLGKRAILNQDCRDRPVDSPADRPSSSRRRRFVCTEPGGTARYREKHLERTEAYYHAKEAMWSGEPFSFPTGMHPPGRRECVGCEPVGADVQSAVDS